MYSFRQILFTFYKNIINIVYKSSICKPIKNNFLFTSFKMYNMNFSKYILPPGTLFLDIPSRGYCPQRLNPFEEAESDMHNIRKVSTINSEEMARRRKLRDKSRETNTELNRDTSNMSADQQAVEMLKKYAP